MDLVLDVAWVVVFVYLLLVTGRFLLGVTMAHSPDWRPHGLALVMTEVCYVATDRPLRLLRSFLPTIRVGRVRFTLDILVLSMVLWFVLTLLTTARNR